ncbi:carotenoid oxygenase family protein [Halocatena marina]|uniref:carotenoid oxygenase family protein n=1 Tax=Halocatena marina TaxID=2934937 RepID=UPI0022257341|nr:carotenoid oxygenase family protein [Halocatena marina]
MGNLEPSQSGKDRPPGFQSLASEIDVDDLSVEGHLPEWLEGTLLRNGPAKFEVGERRLQHWFDGFAMLHRFSFQDGRVGYTNKFLESRAYEHARDEGELRFGEFATDPCRDIFERVFTLFSSRAQTDNANVNIARHADRFVAMTETPLPVEFDPETLESLGVYDYPDDLDGQLTTAHPHHDFERGETVNYVTQFDRQSRYTAYRLVDGAREAIGSATVDEPAYMHSFGLTDQYVILAEFPFVVNPLRLRFGNRPFVENYQWKPERGTRFTVLDRETGDVVARPRTDAFFAFHHVNAYEQDNTVVIDIVTYPDASIIDDFYLDNFATPDAALPGGELSRYRLSIDDGTVTSDTLYDGIIELPRINYKECNTNEHRYVYGVGINRDAPEEFLDRLVKVDINGSTKTWHEPSTHPGEPVFVSAPDATREDQGVILSVVLDSVDDRSFLLVLDAESFKERARATVEHPIPNGFHGQFYSEH